MKYVCIGLLKLYKATLSRLKGRKVCIYTPQLLGLQHGSLRRTRLFCRQLAYA